MDSSSIASGNERPLASAHYTATNPKDMKDFMASFMDSMKANFKAQEAVLKDITNATGGGGGGGGKRKAGGGGYCHWENTKKYCWTHGHKPTSRASRNKAKGHQDGATFSNKMGGSTAFCNSNSQEWSLGEELFNLGHHLYIS